MSRPWIFISPSSRGIGHALTRHLLRTSPLPIIATARSQDTSAVKSSLLKDLDPPLQAVTAASSSPEAAAPEHRLHVLRADVTDEASLADAAGRAAEIFPKDRNHLHLAFGLPGVLHPEKSPQQVDYDAALDSFRINTLGPLMLMKHFTPFLPRKSTNMDLSARAAAEHELSGGSGSGSDVSASDKKNEDLSSRMMLLPPHAVWLSMAARVGSTSDNHKGGWYSYRASKAGVISLARSLDWQLRAQCGETKAMSVAYHPGTVKTDLSKGYWEVSEKQGTLLTPERAAQRLVAVATEEVGLEGRGRCWDWKAEEVKP